MNQDFIERLSAIDGVAEARQGERSVMVFTNVMCDDGKNLFIGLDGDHWSDKAEEDYIKAVHRLIAEKRAEQVQLA